MTGAEAGTRYVIMANGQGMRWGSHLGIPKHLITVDGETLLQRIVRQLRSRDADAEVVISSADPRYDTEGATRHTPRVNELELDRFVPELIVGPVCFLYGDTYYTDHAIDAIVAGRTDSMRFFGDERAIVAVRAAGPDAMLPHLARVRRLYLAGEISSCIGWQVYQSFAELPFEGKRIAAGFERLDGETAGFNTPEDLAAFERLR